MEKGKLPDPGSRETPEQWWSIATSGFWLCNYYWPFITVMAAERQWCIHYGEMWVRKMVPPLKTCVSFPLRLLQGFLWCATWEDVPCALLIALCHLFRRRGVAKKGQDDIWQLIPPIRLLSSRDGTVWSCRHRSEKWSVHRVDVFNKGLWKTALVRSKGSKASKGFVVKAKDW